MAQMDIPIVIVFPIKVVEIVLLRIMKSTIPTVMALYYSIPLLQGKEVSQLGEIMSIPAITLTTLSAVALTHKVKVSNAAILGYRYILLETALSRITLWRISPQALTSNVKVIVLIISFWAMLPARCGKV